MSDLKLVNISRLMSTYNLEIEELPDNLKCVQCKLVLKNAGQLPCCCKFCRACIDDMITRGDEFCPGNSEECRESPLTCFVSDYWANKRISRLTVKCPHDGCMHEFQLINIEQHLRECQRKSEECPFRELGCTQDKLATEEMDGHLQHDNRRHSQILIEMIANINRDIETLKYELVQKDGQIRSIMDQMIHLQNENKSIKNDIKSIKEEKEDLVRQVRILAEKIEQEIAERRENDELDLARVIEHVDTEKAAITRLIGSFKDELATEVQSVRDNIVSINQSVQSIKNEICSVKSQVQSVQAQKEQRQSDAGFVWNDDVDVVKTRWDYGARLSEYFSGDVHPYKYRLASWNWYIGTARAALGIRLCIHAGPNDGQLTWPIEARVVITVTDRDRHEVSISISRQCRIERPVDNDCSRSDSFKFLHSELIKAGLNLSRGVRVSCVIVAGAG